MSPGQSPRRQDKGTGTRWGSHTCPLRTAQEDGCGGGLGKLDKAKPTVGPFHRRGRADHASPRLPAVLDGRHRLRHRHSWALGDCDHLQPWHGVRGPGTSSFGRGLTLSGPAGSVSETLSSLGPSPARGTPGAATGPRMDALSCTPGGMRSCRRGWAAGPCVTPAGRGAPGAPSSSAPPSAAGLAASSQRVAAVHRSGQ